MRHRALPLVVGFAAILWLTGNGTGAGAGTVSPHTVHVLNCSSLGGDQRGTYDASVEPGVIGIARRGRLAASRR